MGVPWGEGVPTTGCVGVMAVGGDVDVVGVEVWGGVPTTICVGVTGGVRTA